MSSTLDKACQQTLLAIARRSIELGARVRHCMPIEPGQWLPDLFVERATFVTLQKEGLLRGCIGTLVPRRPLYLDVHHNAYAAAFRDPRFPPVEESETARLRICISLLGPAEPISFRDEADLVSQLRPFEDGLILEAGYRVGTFLPSVWESLPEPRDFWRELKRKAGLPPDAWPRHLTVKRYRVEKVEEI